MWKDYVAYVNDNPKGYWFKNKLYGWGWTPVRWQGWIAILTYVVLMLAFALTIDESSPPKEVIFTFVFPAVFLTGTLIRICYKTGEKPRWQWGMPKKP